MLPPPQVPVAVDRATATFMVRLHTTAAASRPAAVPLTQRVQVKKPNWELPRVEARRQVEGAVTLARHGDLGGSGGADKLPGVERRAGLKRVKAGGDKEVVRFR